MDRLTPEAFRARLRAAIGEPEITGQGFDLLSARARRRRWWDLGLGTAPAAVRAAAMVSLVTAVAAVVTLGTLINLHVLPKPAGSSSGPAGQSSTLPTGSSLPSPALVPLGPAVDGFVPEDVTAVSADQWWVLGFDGAGCSGAACTRILHTLDGGQTFTSIPTPLAGVTGLRFADPRDGWAYNATMVWSTHDGGADWIAVRFAGMSIEDLEASGGYVYAVTCTSTPVCSLERSPVAEDSWQTLSIPGVVIPSGHVPIGPNPISYLPGSLNVHGSDLWMTFTWINGSSLVNLLMTSANDGEHFGEASICPGNFPILSLYAVNTDVLWATCLSGMQTSVWRSVDGGQTFGLVNAGVGTSTVGIAGTSASSAVDSGLTLQLSVDGGKSFQPVVDQTVVGNGDRWRIVGFTTAEDGFALSYPSAFPASPNGLWRSEDGGTQWYEVRFP